MPEIVEVALMAETIRNSLENSQLKSIQVLGGRYCIYEIQDENGIWISKHKNKMNIDPDLYPGGRYVVRLDGLNEIPLPLKVISVQTKGKFCWIELDLGWFIGLTFGMTGSIQNERTKRSHLLFEAECNNFYYSDPRKFGRITISNVSDVLNRKLSSLGHDLFVPMSDQEFVQLFRSKRFADKNLCKVLMEQRAVSGIGKYLCVELLYACRINPWAIVSDLSDDLLVQVYKTVVTMIQASYEAGCASLYTFVNSQGEKVSSRIS